MYLTASQLSSVRSRPQRTRLWLGIYQPQTIFSTQINQAGISKGAREITVTSLSGNPANVVRGMTCYIGTLAGGRDIGRIRVISATSTLITIAENSYSWVNGWFLTIVQYHEPWTVFPRITLTDANIPVFYKDYDIVYTDQNQYMQPVINMGPHYAGFLDSLVSGTYEQVWYSSSGTFDPTVGGGISSYDWEFEGGMPASSSAANPGWIEYTGSGYYLTRLSAVTDDGKTGTAFRHIMILDRPGGSGTNEPVKAWGLRGFDGDRESGGYTVGLWLREAAGLTAITEGSLVVIFSEDWEGNEPVTKIGANAENRGSIVYSGYVLEDTTYWNPVTSRLEFETASITGRMGELSTFATSVESKTTAATWTELRDMTVDRAAIHMLRWHSTVLEVHDYAQTEDTKWVKFADFERGALYESINNWLMNTLLARMVSDRQGKIWAEVDARVIPTGSERQTNDHMQNVLDMSNSDWRGEISIPRRFESELAYLEMGGINFSGPSETGGVAAFLAGAPGEAPDYFGSVERVQGLVVLNQLQLNELVGYAYEMKNSNYPEVNMPFAGDYRFLDIAPQHRLLVSVAENDTHRGIVWTQKPFIPQEISYQWLPQFQSLLMDIGLAEETGGEPGFGVAATIIIPPDPPYSTPDLPEWELPDFPPTMPPIPEIPPTDFPPSSGNLVYYYLDSTLVRTRNFWDTDPDWEVVPTTGTAGGGQAFQLDPFDPVNSAMLMKHWDDGVSVNTGPYIYRTTNLNSVNPIWTEVWGKAENAAHLPHTSQRKCYDLKPSYLRSGEWYMANRERALGGTPAYRPMRTSDYGGSWTRIWGGIPDSNAADASITPSKGDSHGGLIVWMKTGGVDIWRSANRGGFWVARADMDNAGGQIYTIWGLDSTNYAVCGDQHAPPTFNGYEIWLTTNGAQFWSDITPIWNGYKWGLIRHDNSNAQPRHKFFSTPNSVNWYAFLRQADGVQHIFASRAGVGGNWVVHHHFLGNIEMADANLGNELQFYARGTSTDFEILGSLDGGYNWLDKEGDLAAVLGQAVSNYGSTGIQVVWTV